MLQPTSLTPPIEPYIEWILTGNSSLDCRQNPLPLTRLGELKERLTEVLPNGSKEEIKIRAYVLNFLSFLESEETIPYTQPTTSGSYSLVKRVEALEVFDQVGQNSYALDATILRMAHIGQHLVDNSYFMESFFERFLRLELKDQLYIFQKQPALADYFKIETNLIDLLQNPGSTLESLLQDRDWVMKCGVMNVLHDVLMLGCGPLKVFLFTFKDELEQIIKELDENKFHEINEKCQFLEKYRGHPDIPCALILRYFLDAKHEPNRVARLNNLIGVLNFYAYGNRLSSLLLNPRSTLSILAQAFWRISNPTIPYVLEKFPLSTFLCNVNNYFSESRKDLEQLIQLDSPFPLEDFARLSGFERRIFFEKAIHTSPAWMYLLEQEPQVIRQIYTVLVRDTPNPKNERSRLLDSLIKFLFDAPLHPKVDYGRIFQALNLEVFSSLQSTIKKLSQAKWNIQQLGPLERFYPYLSFSEKVFLLLNRSSADRTYLYEAIRSSSLQPKFQDVLAILELLEHIDKKENIPLAVEALSKLEDLDEIFDNLARSSTFKTSLVTFGQELLLQLHEKKALSNEALFMFGQILPIPLFLKIIEEQDFSILLQNFSKNRISFNGENASIETHLKNLLEAGHDGYTSHFLEILKEKFLGDGKFLVAICRFFPEDLNYKKILQLLPSDLLLYAAHLLPDDKLNSFFCPSLQLPILKILTHMEIGRKNWFIENYKEWISVDVPPFDSMFEKFQALDPQASFEKKMSDLEEIKTTISLHLARQNTLSQIFTRLKKEDPDSLLIPLLLREIEANTPHVEKYKAVLKEIPDEPELFCCISGAFLKNPVQLDDDQSEAIFELGYLHEILSLNGKANKRARWPHVPSNFFSLEDILPVCGGKKEKLDRLKGDLESSIDNFILRIQQTTKT
ncbi:MAG: hypothetical protein FJZ62_03985 [Chlamydiae bacterium]|nr:hypothetical protein [Chlamydiota bacterium]